MGRRRSSHAVVAGVVVLFALGGCAGPAPEPTPTPLFASEEEAFAAAEETYRAYVDEKNAQRDGDENADPDQWLSGLALEASIKSQRTQDEQGIRVAGDTTIDAVSRLSAKLHSTMAVVKLELCIDASQTRLLTDAGMDVTPTDRVARTKAIVSLQLGDGGNYLFDTEIPADSRC